MHTRKLIVLVLTTFLLLILTACAAQQPAEQPTTQQNEMTVDEFEKSELPEKAVESTEGAYVGSVNSNKYHKPNCRWAKKIKPENEIWFASKEEAEEAGYIPCKVCNP